MTPVIETAESLTAQPVASSPPAVRNAVAVIVTRFPRIDETFVLREIDELERIGQPVLVVPLLHGKGPVVHEEARPWTRRALYTRFFSLAILLSNLRMIWRKPRTYVTLLFKLILGTAMRPSTFIRTLALFPKSVHLARLLPSLGIRHIHSYFASHATTMAYIISSLTDVTYSFSVQGPDVFVHRHLLDEKIRGAGFIRTTSVFNKAFLCGLYPELTEGKVEVIHNGVNSELYRRATTEAGPRTGPWKVLTVSAFSPSRGVNFLVEACAQLRKEGLDVECSVIGADATRPHVRETIERVGLGDHIRLLGAQPQHEVARMMGECDVFVLPSIIALNGQMDGIPISLMEAMAAGKPVVAAAISGVPELVKNEVTGLLVDATHVDRLALGIRRLIDDAELRERLGRTGQATVERRFDVRTTATALVDLFDRNDRTNDVPRSISSRIMALDWDRLGVCAVGIRKIRNFAGSSIAEVTITNGISRRDAIVRRQNADTDRSGSAHDRARKEFEVLSVLRQSMAADQFDHTYRTSYTVPRVLMFDERHAAVVVERADGVSLERVLRERKTEGPRLESMVFKTGRWLHVMQSQSRQERSADDVLSSVLAAAIEDLDLAAAAHRPLRRRRDALAATLHRLRQEIPLAGFSVGHHGAFSPENVFLGDDRVTVVDFNGWRAGLPLEDAAQMALQIELSGGRKPAKATTLRLRQAFLAGWTGDDAPPDERAMRFFTLTRALHLLVHTEVGRSGVRNWRRRRQLYAILERSIGR